MVYTSGVEVGRALLLCGKVALITEFCDCVCNCIVEASIDCSELVNLKRYLKLVRKVRDGLAQVAIIVHNLVDAVAEGQQLAIVLGGGRPPIRRRSCSVEGAGKDGTRQWFGRLIKAERLNGYSGAS
jgi:hypothetical protein